MLPNSSNTRSNKTPFAAGPHANRRAPLYYQLAEVLTKQIESGEYKKGDLLPGDHLLASQFGVSVITVRAAMKILIERGLVVRYSGRGSFVANEEPVLARWGLGSVEDLLMTGLRSELVLLDHGLEAAPDWAATKYKLAPRTELYWSRTVRRDKGEPIFFTDIYHPVAIGKKLMRLDFAKAPVKSKLMISLVEKHCRVRLRNINQTMSADLASANAARILRIKAGLPILVVDRDYFSTDDELVQVSRSRYRVDRYRYTINLARINANNAAQD